jgi:DNA-binding transcriptional LysR family regulator
LDLLHHLKTFVCLAEKGCMAEAMDELLYAQPTISSHITNLESYYQCSLLVYRNKRYVLTKEGQVLYDYAKKILTMALEADTAIAEFKEANRGTLSLGASTNIGIYMLPEILGSFRSLYPGLRVKVTVAHTYQIQKKVEDYELNLGIVEADVSADCSLRVEVFKREPLVFIVSPTHPLAQRGQVSVEELIQQPFVVGESGSGTRRALERQIGGVMNTINISFELGSTEAVKKAVENSLGVSIVVASAVSRELAAGTIVAVPIKGFSPYKEYKLIYPKDKYLTAGTRKFLAHMRSLYSANTI